MPAIVIVTAILAGAIWVIPIRSRNPLAETSVWALLVLVAFAGWGSLVRFLIAPRAGVDLGLRIAWGAALACFLGGALMVPALMTHTAALVLVEAGLVLASVSLVRERRSVLRGLHFVTRVGRREPAVSLVVLAASAGVVVHCLAAIADWHTNPYDDDIAYLAFVKKLSDTGTVLEPFSFRRLSAYGGQIFFIELCGVRASASQAHTFDRCVAFAMIVALMLGHRVRGRRPSLLFLIVTILLLVTLESIAINTASYFSGLAFFVALFRTLVWCSDRQLEPWKNALPIALVSVTACTLRQNYLIVPALVLAASYAFRLRNTRGPLVERLAEPLWTAALSVALLVPWFIVSWQSSRTFLYPVIPGTFHKALALNASGWNFVREIAFQTNVFIDGQPLHTLALFILAIVFVRETDPRRPLMSLCIGALGGFVALVHGLTQSDAQNIGRYAFSFLMAIALAAVLTTGSARLTRKPGRLELAAGLVLFALLAQLVESRAALWKESLSLKFHNIEALAYTTPHVPETEPPEMRLYQRLQNSVPPGERIAVVVDEPYYLDFARNPIWNLDMPGYASLSPGMPSFKGSEALETYFRDLGVRWLMFVLPDHSRYHYRREYFLELFVSDQEIWRTYAPYLVDFIDSVVAIQKRHRAAHSERGIVVIDLAEAAR